MPRSRALRHLISPRDLESARIATGNQVSLSSLELLSGFQQSADIDLASPHELVSRPGRDARLPQLLDAGGRRALPLLTEAAGEVVSKSDELVERSRVQTVEFRLFVD
jgi:hypothetical protein